MRCAQNAAFMRELGHTNCIITRKFDLIQLACEKHFYGGPIYQRVNEISLFSLHDLQLHAARTLSHLLICVIFFCLNSARAFLCCVFTQWHTLSCVSSMPTRLKWLLTNDRGSNTYSRVYAFHSGQAIFTKSFVYRRCIGECVRECMLATQKKKTSEAIRSPKWGVGFQFVWILRAEGFCGASIA